MFSALPDRKYEIVYMDPPWDYKGQTQHGGKGKIDTGGAKTHYPTITLKDLKAWSFPDICAENCLMFMWTSSPHFDQAVELGKHWGFAWSTVAFVWYKERTNPGFYTLSECEMCVVFKKGKIPTPRGSRKERQFLSSLREEHSKKPDEVRHRIMRMFPTQAKIEMFARQKSGGWDVWGNEITQEF